MHKPAKALCSWSDGSMVGVLRAGCQAYAAPGSSLCPAHLAEYRGVLKVSKRRRPTTLKQEFLIPEDEMEELANSGAKVVQKRYKPGKA